jgi:O-antigen/teichoic acid export membrane protein
MVSLQNTPFAKGSFVKYLTNTSWLFVERLYRTILNLTVGILVIRYLGPSQLGVLSYSQSITGIISVLAILGLDSIVIRELVARPFERGKLLGTAFFLKLFGGLLAVFVTYCYGICVGKVAANIMLILSVGFLFKCSDVIDFHFQSQVRVKFVAFANIFAITLSAAIKIALITFNCSLEYFAVVFALESVLVGIGLVVIYYFREEGFKDWRFCWDTAKLYFSMCWPLLLSSISVILYMKVDQIMLMEMMDSESVGQYASAMKISESLYFIPVAISNSLFPAIVKYRETDLNLYRARLQQLFSLMFWFAVALALLFNVFGHFVIFELYGEKFAQAENVLKIHVWTGVFVFLATATSKWMLVEGLTKWQLVFTLVSILLNVILNYFLIKSYGAFGAAVATLVVRGICTCLVVFISREIFMMYLKAAVLWKN